MQSIQSSILLVGAEHVTCQWLGLRALLQDQPDLRAPANARGASEALQLATDQRPAHVLVDAAVGGIGLIPLVRQMHRVSPASRVVVIGTRAALHRDTLLQLVEQNVRGYLLWEDLGGETVTQCLAIVREDGLLVEHRLLLEELLAAPERRRRLRNDEPPLTDDERAVLSLLVGDLTQQEIAAALHTSEVTVKRTVATLRAKFGVRTTNALCWQAGRLGFMPQADDSETTSKTFSLTGYGHGGDRNRSRR